MIKYKSKLIKNNTSQTKKERADKSMPKKKINNKISKQREIEPKKRKKRIKILKTVILIFIISVILRFLLKSEKFNIKEIVIEGNNQLKQEEIYNISKIDLGDNIFSTIGIIAKVRLKENGYIENVKIRKKYPNKIVIEIQERKIQYQVLTESGGYIYIDEQGYIIDYSLEKLDITTITGMNILDKDVEKIKRLEEVDLEKMEKILHINEEIKKIELEENIQQIDTKEEYVIHIDNDFLIINLGDATNLSNRMYYVKAILKQEAGNSGTIYVNGNINEQFAPYFKAK